MNATEEAVQTDAARRLALLGAYSRDVLCELRQGVITYVSPNTSSVSGLPPEQFVGRAIEDIVHPDDLSALQPFLAPGWTGAIETTFRIITADGTWQRREAHGARDFDADGVHSTVLVLRDVTDRQRAEDAALQSETRSRALLTAMPDLMFRLSRDGCYLDFKAERAEELVVPPETVIGGYVRNLLAPELAEKVMDTIRRALDEGGVHTLEYSLTKPIGVREIEGRFVACADDEVLVISRDITDRKRIARELAESEQRYRSVIEGARDIVYTHDLEGNFTSVNGVASQVYGYSVDELLHMSLADIVDPAHLGPAIENMQRALEGEPMLAPLEFLTHAKDGSQRWVEVVADPILRENAITGFQGIVRDITERKRAEERVHFQAQLLDAISQAVFVVDSEGKIAFWNKYSEKIYGISAGEAIGRPITDFKPSDDRKDALDAYEHVLRGEHWTGEVNAALPGGASFPILVAAGPIHDVHGVRVGVACMTAEIGALKQAQREAQSAHEQAALSEERARIAQELHDNVAQYFFGIGMASKELTERAAVSPTLMKRKLAQIRRLSAQGGREIRNAINSLAPLDDAPSLEVALAPLLNEMRAGGLRVTYVEQSVHPLPAAVNALLHVVARELLFNIRKHARATEAHVRLTADSRRATLTVSDNGVGRAHSVQSSIEEGTGFGLRSLRLRLKQRGGTISVTDRRGSGGLRIVCTIPLGETP